jgi:superfamily II DNA or RNA helicase
MIAKTEQAQAAAEELQETLATLTGLAEGKTGAFPAEALARHVVGVTPEGDRAVRRAALEAALRRFAAAEELRVARRRNGYVARRGREPRPYATVLWSLEPLRGSCDCRDFLRNSLGLCKHLAAVLARLGTRAALSRMPSVVWDPVRPLEGQGDWLGRVRGVRNAHATDPRRRLALVRDLRPAPEAPSDPALKALLEREASLCARRAALREALPSLLRTLKTLKRGLYPYQREGVERFLAAGSLLLGDDMGLGKTAQAIASCHALWHSGRARRGLLIVPASLKGQWEREWKLFTDAPIAIVEGAPGERAARYRKGKGFLVVNYEQVLKDLEGMRGYRPDLVVLDEAQRIKNWATKTAAFVKTFQPPYRLVLTGTPMENRLEELASILEWVDDMALEPKWRLGPAHAVRADGAREIIGAKGLSTLRSRLEPCLVRRLRRDVLKQLPPRTDTTVPVGMTEAQVERHEDLRPPILRLAGIARRRPLTREEFLKLMQLLTTQRVICNGLAQLEFAEVFPSLDGRPREKVLKTLDSPKLMEFREIVGQVAIDQGRKMVVFSQWRRMLRLAHWSVEDVLGAGGHKAAFFTGQESARRRTENVVSFHDDESTRVLFCTDAGGVGLNLQRAANCCVNLELPWNPAVLEQRIGRIHRLGQEDPIDVYNLVAADGIEGRIASLVADKQALFKGLFDGTSDVVRFEGASSFFSRLEQVLEAPEVPAAAARGADDESLEERAIEPVLDAADEARDAAPEAVPQLPARTARIASADVPALAARAAALPAPEAPAPSPAPPHVPAPFADLFKGIRVAPTPGGGLRLEAPPESAGALLDLFEGMARLLREGAAATVEK